MTAREFLDGYTLSQLTPGPTMLVSIFVGYRAPGLPDVAPSSGHPSSTLGFLDPRPLIVIAAPAHDPKIRAIGFALLLVGLPVYLLWRRRRT